MNILIPASWLREHLKTNASSKEIANSLSLTSVSVERTEKIDSDDVFDIEVTTNRPDLMSIVGIAREANAALKEENIESKFDPISIKNVEKSTQKFPIDIKNDSKLVNRICAVIIEIEVKESPKIIRDKLERSGIRSLNNIIDVTNYVMRETGHPTHVFDLDRLNTKTLTITSSQKGDVLETLDHKNYNLLGNDIIALDDNGRIVDLLGVMGTANSVVNSQSKRILFFVDNNNPINIRNTSMNLGIRTEAAVINEKGIDPELSMIALLRGIELYKEIANGKVASEILDIYPNKPKEKVISVSIGKINKLIGIDFPLSKAVQILEDLDFKVEKGRENIIVTVPSVREKDIEIEEDIIEEIARIYGYHKLPSVIPTFLNNKPYKFADKFYFEGRAKNAMKYLGFTEVYTYSLVSEEIFEGPIENGVKLKNPLSEDMEYLRVSIIPSLLNVLEENKKYSEIKIFEIANTYHRTKDDLPVERLTFAGLMKKPNASFFELKGIIEAILEDIGIKDLKFRQKEDGVGATVSNGDKKIGYIEALNNNVIDFELNFEEILSSANLDKRFKKLAKFPPIIEDLSLEVGDDIRALDIISEIKLQSNIIIEVSLMDEFGPKKTFHIIYQDSTKNLTGTEVSKIREKVIKALQDRFSAIIR